MGIVILASLAYKGKGISRSGRASGRKMPYCGMVQSFGS